MSIAQRSVAGEGEIRLRSDESGNASVISPAGEDRDAAALRAFETDATNLPWIVFRAVFRASQIDGLPARARALFAALARTVDATRPYAAIYARRELLNDRSLLSRRTLYRALTDLEAAGLIHRAGQLRIASEGYEGQFGRTYLHLTEHAATLLGFITPREASASVAEEDPNNVADQGSEPAPRSFATPGATVALGANIRDLSPASYQKRQPGQVPADLERLRTLGFSKFLIFGLMRDAREHGKRLSDVVEATWTHLKQANRPICYLRALLRSTVDFSYQLRARQAEDAARRDAEDEQEAAARLAHQAAGSTYIDPTAERRIDVDADGQGATVRLQSEGVPRREAGNWALRFLRAVRSGQLRPATAADIEAFAQASRHHAVISPAQPTVPRSVTPTVSVHLADLRALVRSAGRGIPPDPR
ncbi:hypothetical protein FAZ95_38760 [Trinickia violacea]|uniref:Replication protein O n=1 Tax=Trinickia violacea TaxID=2571746 RepID=A0A4P8J408_9BURK|nr:hypothetical protein [Trinickia violacea]QCP55083.1 hypothetical protein FAZ95_38760 [Trinickia violacea]